MSCCKTCFKICDKVPDCLETLSIQTEAASQQIKVSIIDKFDHQFSQTITTDAEGLAEIDISDSALFPVGLLNRYAGEFKVKMEDSGGVIIPFVNEGVEYDCIQFSVGYITPLVENYLITI